MPAKEAWGLDIGQAAVRLVKMQRLVDGVQISDYAVAPIETFPEDPDYEDKVIEILRGLIMQKNIGSTPVVVGLNGFNTLFRDFPLPAISAAKMDEIVSYEARQQIPYPLEEVLWDYHRYQADETSAEVNIALVCCRRDIVENFMAFLQQLNLNIVAIQVGPLALANYLLYDQGLDGVHLVLDSGARATDFLILNNGNFWLRSIAIGGNELTRALMSKFNLPFTDAEELKERSDQESKQGQRVFKVMQPVLRTLTGEVQRSLGYYKSIYRGIRIDNAVAGGGLYEKEGSAEMLQEQIGFPVARIGEVERIRLAPGVDAGRFQGEAQRMGVTLGLALQGVGAGEINVNLLPPEVQRRRLIQAKLPYAAAAVALLAVAVLVNLFVAVSRAGRWDAQIERLEEVVGSGGLVDRARNQLRQAEAASAPAREKGANLAQVALGRDDVRKVAARVLSEVARLNEERAEEVEASNEFDRVLAEQTRRLTDVTRMPASIRQIYQDLGNVVNGEELRENLLDELRTTARRRAELITRRRRRIFPEVQKVLLDRVKFYTDAEDPDDPEAEWMSAEEATETLKRIARSEGAEIASTRKGELKDCPFEIVKVVLTGYSVSKPEELADVVNLRKRFLEVEDAYFAEVDRMTERNAHEIGLPLPSLATFEAAVGSGGGATRQPAARGDEFGMEEIGRASCRERV
jgi:type IV pilus assembly protein PilM